MPLFIHWRLPRAATTGHRSLSTATRWRPVSSTCRIGATMGRRWCGRRRRAPRATGSACATPRSRRHLREGSPPLSRSDISDWRDATLYPLAAAARRDDRPSVAQHSDPLASCSSHCRIGATMGRRWCGRRRRAPRATGSACATPRSRRHLREGSPPLSRSDISDWRDATLYPLAAAARRDDRPSVAQHSDPLASCFVDLPDRGDDGPALVRSAASSAASYGVGVRNTPIATAPARGVTAALSL